MNKCIYLNVNDGCFCLQMLKLNSSNMSIDLILTAVNKYNRYYKMNVDILPVHKYQKIMIRNAARQCQGL